MACRWGVVRIEPARRRVSRSIGSTLVLLAAALLLSQAACGVHRHGHGTKAAVVYRDDASARVPELPPWAPAHGHRHKHRQGVDLRYDARLGVYLVVRHPGRYFRGELFYRQLNGSWSASAGVDGPWWTIAVEDVPLGLRRTHAKQKRHPKHGGSPPARHH